MHVPVFLKETIEYLNPKSGGNFVDATVGAGGHSLEILKKTAPKGRIIGIEADIEAFKRLKKIIKELDLEKKFIVVHNNFVLLKKIIKENKFQPVDGILFDLGLSSELIEDSGRGFSFMRQEVLDMRLNPQKQTLTAAHILNQYSEQDLESIFKDYGGERFAKRIARRIIQERKKQRIISTDQLAVIVKKSLGRYYHIKSLARVFQALRIEVNQELENLEKALIQALEVLSPQGRIVVLSYHSGEDRIVKRFFKNQNNLKILTKKPLCPTLKEIKENPRARSAKLRAGEKM